MENPLVSIAIPCYNHESYVQDCIKSIIDQDYLNIELIIIDDGSTDQSANRIREMQGICMKRFKRFEFRSRANVGLSATLNEAISWCAGKYYSAIASDDQMYSFKTTLQLNYLELHPDCLAVFGSTSIINAENEVLKQAPSINKTYKFSDIFLHKHDLPAATQMIRLDKLKAVGGFRNDIVLEDWYMWLKLTESGGSIDRISDVVSAYRRHEENFSKKINIMSAGRIKVAELFKYHRHYKIAVASAYLVDAASLQIFEKRKSFSYVKQAVKANAMIIFSIQFMKYLIKLMLPKRVLLQKFGN